MWKGRLAGGWGELREADPTCGISGQLSLGYTAYLWVECLQEMWKNVNQECGLPAQGFLSNCWGIGLFFFPLPL